MISLKKWITMLTHFSNLPTKPHRTVCPQKLTKKKFRNTIDETDKGQVENSRQVRSYTLKLLTCSFTWSLLPIFWMLIDSRDRDSYTWTSF